MDHIDESQPTSVSVLMVHADQGPSLMELRIHLSVTGDKSCLPNDTASHAIS